MQSDPTTLVKGSDEAFQRLLLRFSEAAAGGMDDVALIDLFCQTTREFFQVSGSYFWQLVGPNELRGAAADGVMAEKILGYRLTNQMPSVVLETVQSRRTLYVNYLDPDKYPLAGEFGTRAILAAPLVVCNEVIGATAFLHDADPGFFNDDLAAKATILAGQLGSLLEASRLNKVSREEHRRAEILAEVAQALNAVPDVSAVLEALADRIRVLLRARVVCVLMRRDAVFELSTVAAESPQIANTVRARHGRTGLRFATDLAARAVAAGEPVMVSVSSESHALGELVPSGMLIAAPFRTSRTHGAVLVYPRQQGVFTADEKSLVASVCGFGAVAIANAELYGTAREQAHELHQLLEISSQLGGIGELDRFLQTFVMRAADFLRFGRCFIGLLEENVFRVQWGAENGAARRVDLTIPEGVATDALKSKDVFWTNDATKVPGANLDAISKFQIKQLLGVPLLASDGRVFGMFGMLDRLDGQSITEEDVRRARSLAAQAAVALEATRNLHLSDQHRDRAEALMGLARELSTLLHLPEFVRNFAARAAELLQAHAAALVQLQDPALETAVLRGVPDRTCIDSNLLKRLSYALGGSAADPTKNFLFLPARELLGTELAEMLGWKDCTLVRMTGASGELVGLLCLADRGKPVTAEDRGLLEAIASHASVALENARLFTRMEQASRHWMEIFDAITDFIVVHDEGQNILRVNRSLADFIGVPPSELVGVNMRALEALSASAPHSCPFCRTGNGNDDYVYPVMERTYLVSTSRIHGASTETLQTVHVLKDITDRREAERRYRELFDTIQEGLFFSTPQGRFVEVNDALVRILGYSSREDLLQVDIPTQVYLNPDRRHLIEDELKRQGTVKNYEETLQRKDGSLIHVLINSFAVMDDKGKILQYRGLMLDVTGLKTSQIELQRERDFSDKILNNTQSLILVVDTAGLVSYANRRWLDLGFEQRQLLGRPLLDLVSPPRRQALQDGLAATVDGHQIDNIDLHLLRGDGKVGQFSGNLSPMRDEQGNVSSIVMVLTDITDAALLQSKLMHAEKMAAVGQLVSGVAHEVNNPLTAILGFADLLMESPELPETARRDLRVILQEAQRTKQIVQNLLSFARQMPPQRKPVQLNTILRRTVQLRAYDFNSHGVEIIERLHEDLPYVVGDAHQLQQVFLNILNNAYDAVRDTGRMAKIEISTSFQGPVVEVHFKDNGHGIVHPDRIFDPFFTTKEVGKGTGLGLSICYGIVREHGGEILSHNNAGSEGATFTVRLPAAADQASVGAAAGVKQR